MSWNKTSMECSFDIPDTPENKEAIEALIGQCEEAGRKEVERIKQMLSDACEEEAMKWTVDNPLIDEVCRSTLKRCSSPALSSVGTFARSIIARFLRNR